MIFCHNRAALLSDLAGSGSSVGFRAEHMCVCTWERESLSVCRYFQRAHNKSVRSVGLQIYKMINLGSNVIVYKLKHCVLHFEVNMMTF